MGIGGYGRDGGRCSAWLWRLLLCAWLLAGAMGVAGATSKAPGAVPLRLEQVREGADAPLDIDGLRRAHATIALEPPAPRIRGRAGTDAWWRITAPDGVPAAGQPQLLLRTPYLSRVEAWLPGRATPVRASLYGPDADPSRAHRALVIPLADGLAPGEAVWLRLAAGSSLAMDAAIEPLAQVRRDDLAYVAWRSAVLTVLLLLAVLAVVFRVGTGESSFAWFGAMLGFAVLYLVSIGGDARLVPGLDRVFADPRTNLVVGGLGVVCSNLFQRSYLDLPGRLRGLDRLLWVGTALAGACAIGALVHRAPWQAPAGNVGLVMSASLLLVGSTVLALRGDRAGRVVMVSWLPLMVTTTLVATGHMGLWTPPRWLGESLAASFALASLLMAIGLADKLLELRRDRDQASALAVVDRLTGLLNRAGVEAGLRRALLAAQARGGTMSIAFVDLDNFKPVNDVHGHGVGDEYLRVVSERVRAALREGDVIGRYGGDEFLVVLPRTALGEALAVAERMRASVRGRPLVIGPLGLEGSLSIGVAESMPGDTPEALVGRADAALYASKQAGRDRVSGTPQRMADGIPA